MSFCSPFRPLAASRLSRARAISEGPAVVAVVAVVSAVVVDDDDDDFAAVGAVIAVEHAVAAAAEFVLVTTIGRIRRLKSVVEESCNSDHSNIDKVSFDAGPNPAMSNPA